MKHIYNLNLLIVLTATFITARADASGGSAGPGTTNIALTSSLTIEAAIHEALGNSPKIKKSEAIIEEMDWGKVTGRSGFLPKISVSANHFFDNTFQYITTAGPAPTTFSLVYPYTTLNLDASITLFDGFQAYNQYMGSKLKYEAAALEDSYTKLQVEEDVRLKFYQALAAQALELVADLNLKTLDDHLQKIQTQTRAGTATRFDLLRIEVQLNDARTEKLVAQDSIAITKLKLAQAMGNEVEVREIKGELPAPNPDILKNVFVEKAKRADIAAKDLQVEAVERKRKESNGFWYPKISLNYEYQLYDNADRSFDSSNQSYHNTYFIGATLTWNLFDGGATLARSQENAARLKEAEASIRMARIQVPQDIENWKRKYALSSQVYFAKSSDVQKAEESVRLATLGLRAGTRTSTEVLDSELDLFRARAGVVKAQVDAIEAKTNLELALGQKF
jgi:outer membrane protein TolC